MNPDQIRAMVRNRYGAIADGAASSCCAPSSAGVSCCGGGESPSSDDLARRMGYGDDDLEAAGAGNLGLGCGNPQAIAAMRPGEVVVDLGSGAGFDCFLAAAQVGESGHVIGIDMTHEMLAKARDNAAKLGLTQVEFRLGEIEHLPIADNVADVVISNCVINLSPDKPGVLREAFRVLKPGGRVAVSDVVMLKTLPPELATRTELFAGCVGGAASADDLRRWLGEAGFVDIKVEPKSESRDLIREWAPGLGVEDYVASAVIQARKP
ncbi:arsenite methyltransferase [Magnetospirillum gryphiswaldense]|uniref:Arsenite methyltransferase n=1 Tax=Magnetospirillum gryphiswaldense TaxID=55518 RepID=A4U276_9PROT|nr:arsenite methyltransferase [Magnetospirillum gryphiswaldense]AVM74921.1 Ubiquinone/menaquinone biosynthesis C-methyltransferase UbiE [Magnetospirillum gryphiswaldense MSR-1]AVM78824.1 Ubiquinone/menaquinone biosynthesis C-methyltransferase UbiE [Magnetospirillum gryphiswaldense]CAM76983.1 ubiE/COQ5 methyltransferase [Magnetospirillum gryphiswaldense MSR-1]